jgi:hypothetical protein
MVSSTELGQSFVFSGEHKSVSVTKKDGLYYFLYVFYFCGYVLCWFIFVAILGNLIGSSFGVLIVSTIATLAVNEGLRRLINQRNKNEVTIRLFDVYLDSKGIRYVIGRTVTFYDWSDVRSVNEIEDTIAVSFIGGDADLTISKNSFKNAHELSSFLAFTQEQISVTTSGTA